MKKLLLVVSLISAFTLVKAQQDPQFTQNYFNRLFYNPAVAGSSGTICGDLFARHQWVGFDGKPETYLFNAQMPFTDPWLGQNHGVGLSVLSDKLGQESTFGLKLAYAYKLPFTVSGGTISAGFTLGMINKSIGNDWNAVQDYYQDQSIPDAGTSDMAFDMDFGLYYTIPNKLYFGISATHLNQATMEDDGTVDNFTNTQTGTSTLNYGNAMHLYVMAGYEQQVFDPKIILKPNFMLRTDAVSASFDLGVLVEYNKMFWGGVSYRLQDAISPMAGVKYTFPGSGVSGGTLKFGYSYDVTTSLLRQHSSGTHELMLGYCFGITPAVKPQGHRTVIWL
ncbi:MAG: hypothetical protein CL843_02340 [Crocinitomicaceae bacterium]|nr:hypothetical protein [Crocinitomicaceae bacterium]|tara:strand:+ start:686 stop:1693 length:1008 start_codon:yes stop_codon:yes gene_type:complete